MKQNISTLMDGELCGDEAEVLLSRITSHPEVRQEWLTYHLIGDVMRQPDYVPGALKSGFFERLHAEPTVLAPHRKRSAQADFFALSAVASIMAMAFLAWLSVQIDSEPVPRQSSAALSNANFPVNDSMNDYLLAHHEFSPATDMQGAASYIRTVADRQSGAGR